MYIKCYKFVAFIGIITMGAAFFIRVLTFEEFTFEGCCPSSAGKPREVAIAIHGDILLPRTKWISFCHFGASSLENVNQYSVYSDAIINAEYYS